MPEVKKYSYFTESPPVCESPEEAQDVRRIPARTMLLRNGPNLLMDTLDRGWAFDNICAS